MARREHDRQPTRPPARPTVLLARDFPPDLVRRRTRAGEWERISRGIYIPAVGAGDLDRCRQIAFARLLGVHDRTRSPHWFSHESAALLWDLPLWRSPDQTHVMQRYTTGTGGDPDVAHHPVVPPASHTAVRHGLPVTSLERTVVDCVSTLPPLLGIVIADAALRVGADRAVIDSALAAAAGRRGIRRARAIVELADDGAESPGESATRFVTLRDGLPPARTQVPVATRLGTFWADMGWEEWRLLLEYDGRTKYAEHDAEAFMREKRRHDALVEAGWRALRVTKEDLSGRTLLNRITPLLPPGTRLRPRPALRG